MLAVRTPPIGPEAAASVGCFDLETFLRDDPEMTYMVEHIGPNEVELRKYTKQLRTYKPQLVQVFLQNKQTFHKIFTEKLQAIQRGRAPYSLIDFFLYIRSPEGHILL